MTDKALLKTALHAMHIDAGARMVSFAGYDMPVQYSSLKEEHLHTREAASLFDVSHMGQLVVKGSGVTTKLERLVPLDLAAMMTGDMSYTFLPADDGGIIDDLIVTKIADDQFFVVINASRIQEDMAQFSTVFDANEMTLLRDKALLALQGPQAAKALTSIFPELTGLVESLSFMQAGSERVRLDGEEVELFITRSGYTGEDGFELSVDNHFAPALAKILLVSDVIEWAGLGARDTLRLEAGLCLYGNDLSLETSACEAGLMWSVSATRRRTSEKPGGFVGDQALFSQQKQGVSRKRVGLVGEVKTPIRAGTNIQKKTGELVGKVTSGTISPSLNKPIAMAYVDAAILASEEQLFASVRGKALPVKVAKFPFVPQRYKR